MIGNITTSVLQKITPQKKRAVDYDAANKESGEQGAREHRQGQEEKTYEAPQEKITVQELNQYLQELNDHQYYQGKGLKFALNEKEESLSVEVIDRNGRLVQTLSAHQVQKLVRNIKAPLKKGSLLDISI